ncbi:hypothetical protein [Sphingomonas faeni]|uniref:hypothetical protein n=1 Tax=Sphingomonas faeni TaxID=185950 RepID=UPI0020C79EC4|nr:hypothetical protein [Sphingomonas faeni]MCP8889715.1 hypothetical protein [Sphingomonas faeni]
MQPRFLAGAGSRSRAHASPASPRPATALARRPAQHTAVCARATAIAAEAEDQRVTQRIKGRQTERFR